MMQKQLSITLGQKSLPQMKMHFVCHNSNNIHWSKNERETLELCKLL